MKKLFICDERMVDSYRDRWVITDLVDMIDIILNKQHNEKYSLYTQTFNGIEFDMKRTIYLFDVDDDNTLLVSKLLSYLNNIDADIDYRLV